MTLQDKLDWVMGIWHESQAYIGEIVCENKDCPNFGSFTNCYDETRKECYYYTLQSRIKKDVNKQ